MKLYVIAGHGQGDPGACANGYSEAERVRALANKLVELGGGEVGCYDQSKDLYQQGGPRNLGIGLDVPCLELHQDSASASAKGGHVIIKEGFSADSYDTALANFVSGFFPGRAQSIVGRSDLQNINVAASVGQNYRLLECCFITNADDITKFNNNLDAFARGILACFGIKTEGDDMQPADVWNYTYAGSPNCFNALHWMYQEVMRKDDPTGRGQECTTHEHVKWIAAAINGDDANPGLRERMIELEERQEAMDAKLDKLIAMMDEPEVKAESTE